MGKSKRKQRSALVQGNTSDQPQAVDTLGGRMHVRWDRRSRLRLTQTITVAKRSG